MPDSVRRSKVLLEGTDLFVLANAQKYRVPVSEIAAIHENRQRLTVDLKEDFGFGRSFSFMPQLKLYWPWRDHPIVEELRSLSRESDKLTS